MEKVSISDETSLDGDERIDEDSIKQKVDNAVESLEKLRKSNSSTCRKKGSNKSNHKSSGSSDAVDQDFDDSNTSSGGRKNENWDAFQSLLMRDDEAIVNKVEKYQPVDVRNEHFIVRSSGAGISLASNPAMDLDLELEKYQTNALLRVIPLLWLKGMGDMRIELGWKILKMQRVFD